MRISYYPGCTLKNTALNFEESAIVALRELGVELEELNHWNCCGTVFSFATDNVMYHLAPIRNLIRVREEHNAEKLFTLCSMCLNTLKRANKLFNEDEEKREKIRNIMDHEEVQYDGKAKVVHILEVLRDDIGFDRIREKTGGRLEGLKIAPYYGCMLVRPDGIGIDDVESPSIFEEMVEATGAKAVDFPYRTECCGSYQTVTNPSIVTECTYAIIGSALRSAADAVIVSCPLCAYNLDQRQKDVQKAYPDFQTLPILYLTEYLCLALGLDIKEEWKPLHYIPVDDLEKEIKTAKV